MNLSKHVTLDNILKTLLAVAVGVLLYNVFFKKSEKYYNYQELDSQRNVAYPMDYEEDFAAEDDEAVVDPIMEEVEEVVDDSEETEEVFDDSEDVVLDPDVDSEMYEYEETDEPYDDSADAEDDLIPDEIYEEADTEDTEDVADEIQSFDYLYASDVEDGLENFVLYENDVGVDVNYS
ncbi:hypothetical protein PBCVNEJV1_739L [Paramecium bursaria Chlorella virus NE-JV-1]|nr:hypothetical protein PBCVNEJV1_739L [Paramecium bursaria Chlorella virus NE-JV-1]